MNTSKLELISYHLCPYVQRAIITLLEKNIPHERTYIDLSNKPDWFLQISPLAQVPLLKVDGEILFESAVICEYLDEITPGSLHPASPLLKAKHRAWIEFGSNILNQIAGFYSSKDEGLFEQKRHILTDRFKRIEQNLIENGYFAGENFSLVDAVYAPIFRYFNIFEQIFDFNFFSDTPKIIQWRENLRLRPSVQNSVVSDYDERLFAFLKSRNSYLATLIS